MQNNVKQRNPQIVTPMGNFLLGIGDTHFGREFKNDVLIEHRGVYEEKQYEVFNQLLEQPLPKNSIRIQVGDLFDKPSVGMQYLLYTLKDLYDYEKSSMPEKLYLLSGNHDDSKNSTKTAWQVIQTAVRNNNKVKAVQDWCIHTFPNGEKILLLGWNITKNAAEAFLEAYEYNERKPFTTVVCHLDKISYGNDANVIPYEFFHNYGVKLIVSGHEHKPYHFYELGMECIGTGSLLPFSHAEDDGDNIYKTFNSLEELNAFVADPENTLDGKHVRVYLDTENGEFIPDPSEYGSLSLKIVKKQLVSLECDYSEPVVEVKIQDYNPKSIWLSVAKEDELTDQQTNKLWADIEAKGIEAE